MQECFYASVYMEVQVLRFFKLKWTHCATVQTHERSKRTLLTGTKHNLQVLGVMPLIKLQNDIETTVKRPKTILKKERKDGKLIHLSHLLFLVDLSCLPVKRWTENNLYPPVPPHPPPRSHHHQKKNKKR